MLVQFLIRLELLLFNWMACTRLAKAVDFYFKNQSSSVQKRKSDTTIQSRTIGSYYLLITAAQFHIPFYSSRLLPNTFALLLVTNAYADWFRGYYKRTAMYLVFTAGIFRCDMLLLLFTVGLCMLIRRQLTIVQALGIGITTGIISLIMTVPLDSLLWGRLIWPEFEVWWFNTVDNRSSEWGEMVWHWYFTRALPKGLMATVCLIPLAFVRVPEFVGRLTTKKSNGVAQSQALIDWSMFPFVAPILAFVMIYSFLPHKEIRFIFPTISMFNVCAAYGMSKLHQLAHPTLESKRQQSNWAYKLLFLCGLGTIILTSVASLIFLRLSIENYPGGEALLRLRNHLMDTIPHQNDGKAEWNSVHLHVDVAAAMTGVSLFGQRHASIREVGEDHVFQGPFLIDKSGYEEENRTGETQMLSFTHLLTEMTRVDGYHLIDAIKGYPRLDIRNLGVATDEAIFIYEKDDWRQSAV